MDEHGRFWALYIVYLTTMAGALLHFEMSRPERMALEGFIPYRLNGDTTTYYYKLGEGENAKPVLRSF